MTSEEGIHGTFMFDSSLVQWWLSRGVDLLPCRKDTKFLLRGYGPHQRKIKTEEEAVRFFFPGSKYNLAVCANGGMVILDFDDAGLYAKWAGAHSEISQTYTERTPSGGAHVFLFGSVPSGLKLKKGVELKRVCVVNPSRVGGVQYTRGEGEILEAEPTEIFFLLSEPGFKSAYVLGVEQRQAERRAERAETLIEKIKRANRIEHVFSVYRPDADLKGSDRYEMVLCPFHDDHSPSMFIDKQLQIYKCFACGARGDVINLYAHFQGVSTREAIARLARSLPRGMA